MAQSDEADDEMYCERHDLAEPVYKEDPHCPYCRQEAARDAMIAEMAARRSDPNMHPTVDARRR